MSGQMYPNDKTTTVRTLISRWNDRQAELVYIFTELREYENGEREVVKQESGDAAWADRMVEHYGLTLPGTKDE